MNIIFIILVLFVLSILIIFLYSSLVLAKEEDDYFQKYFDKEE